MLIGRIDLRNFGPLRGYHRVELRPLDTARPIVLFGGKNGAGKTTILEAIRLCLFGRHSLGARSTQAAYEAYLASKIYRGGPDSLAPRKAAVGVEFEHGHAGERSLYAVERGWERRGKRIIEDLLVTRDGQLLRGLDREHWQDFINNLIPPPLAQLFFFDGERIQALAEDVDDSELPSAVRSLLGLDLVEQLQSDLNVYLSRQGAQSDDSRVRRLAQVLEECRERAEVLRALDEHAKDLADQIAQQRAAIRRHEELLAREGGNFALQRASLEAQRKQLEASRRAAEDRLREMCAGLLPFALIPDLCRRTVSVLTHEEQQQAGTIAAKAVSSALSQIQSVLGKEAFWKEYLDGAVPPSAQEELRAGVLSVVRRALGPVGDGLDGTPLVHGLAPADGQRIKSLLGRALDEIVPEAGRIAQELARSVDELRLVEQNLGRAPSEDSVRPLFDRLAALHGELAELEHRLAATEAEVKEAAYRELQASRERRRLESELAQTTDTEKRVRLAARVQSALVEFHARLSRNRLEELEQTVSHCFSRLARKDDLVSRIEIDPDTFRVTLFDQMGHAIPKARLSAGEKQIYAVALLWALAKVSGRRLPVIIDTPLGRLDSDHRRNLVSHYFPYAAEQVIILSTDTEIDRSLMVRLGAAVSRYYRVEYDPTQRASRVLEGYFWYPNGNAQEPGEQVEEGDQIGDVQLEVERGEQGSPLEPAPLSARDHVPAS